MMRVEVGVRNQVRGGERMWDWCVPARVCACAFVCVEGVGRKFCRNLWGFTFASLPQIRGQSLWLLTSVASVSPGWEMGACGPSHLLACWD